MIKTQILEAIKQMPNSDRLEVIEFALKLLRQDIDKPEKLSLREAAEIKLCVLSMLKTVA